MTGINAKAFPTFPRAPELNRSFLLMLGITTRALRAAFEQYLGITEARLRLLGELFSEHELSQAELQRRLEIDGAAITRQVKQMESEGFLARRPDPNDNRYTLVHLTPGGHELIRELAVKGQEFERRVLHDMAAEDIACVARILTQLRENLARLGDRAEFHGNGEEESRA